MKLMRNSPVVWACLTAAMLCSGCSQKKPVAVVPPQAPPAAVAPPPAPQPTPAEAQAQSQESQPATQGTPPPEPQPGQLGAEKTDANTTKNAKPKTTAKKTVPETARNNPPKKVVGEAEPAPAVGQISPALPNAEIVHTQASTEQLLQSTEAALNGIKRQLSQDEQAVVAQIRDYVNQSRQATKANDVTRAYNLALKAQLLSNDLAKRQ